MSYSVSNSGNAQWFLLRVLYHILGQDLNDPATGKAEEIIQTILKEFDKDEFCFCSELRCRYAAQFVGTVDSHVME